MDSPSVCGYINGLQTSAITCSTGYCGFNSLYNAAGCCASTISLPPPHNSASSDYSLVSCTFTTTCIDSTDISPTDGWDFNTMDLYCTDPLSPICAQYTFTDAGYAALFCSDTKTVVEAALTVVDAGVASASGGTAAAVASVTEKFPVATTAPAAAATTTAGGQAAARTSEAADATASVTGGGGGGVGAGNPFSKAQGSVGEGVGGAVGSATMVRGNGCDGGGRGRAGLVAVVAVGIVGFWGAVV